MSGRPLYRTLRFAACATVMSCASGERNSAPKVLAVFSMGGDLAFVEQTTKQLLWFHFLGEQSSPQPQPTVTLDDTPLAVRCVSASEEVVEQGECGLAQGAALVACVKSGTGFALQRIDLSSNVSGSPTQSAVSAMLSHIPVGVDCSRMSVLDKNTVVLAAPELFNSGVSRFQQDAAGAPFASVVDLETGEERWFNAVPSALAPIGAETDALLRVEVFADYAVLVFRSYVGVATLRENTDVGITAGKANQYRFIDLFEGDGTASDRASGDPLETAPLVHVADSRLLVAVRRGSSNAFAAPLPDFQFLNRLVLPEPVTALQSFQFGASKRLLLLTAADGDGRSHLQVINPFPFELAATEVILPGSADMLTASAHSSSTATTLTTPAMLAWSSEMANTTLNVVAPELVPIPNASAVRTFSVPGGFIEAVPLDADLVVLNGSANDPLASRFLVPSDGAVHSILTSEEHPVGIATLFGPYITAAVEREGAYSQVFVTPEGARVATLPLHGLPNRTLKYSTCSSCCSTDPSCRSTPLRMAVLFDDPLGRLDIISGLPPTAQDSANGFLGAALWSQLP